MLKLKLQYFGHHQFNLCLEWLKNNSESSLQRFFWQLIFYIKSGKNDKKSDDGRSKTGLFYLYAEQLFTTPDVDMYIAIQEAFASTVGTV